MKLQVTDKYLWFPVSGNNNEIKLHFLSNGEKIQEMDVKLGAEGEDFNFAMDVSSYLGQEIEIYSDPDGPIPDGICCHADKPDTDHPYRPVIHFTAAQGWINDPNGLVYSDGIYHLYHQWNPYGTDWGNMHWGHAVSRDMITWEIHPVAMEPDEFGTIFSGSGWQDREDAAGFGKDALLFFYTAAGGTNKWSSEKGNKHTQRLAVSEDGGETLRKKGLILDHIKGGNRDPKVFYHRESGAYIMVLYLDKYEFAIFRSEDLLHWNETHRFSAEKMNECPDLFELSINNGSDKKWVFWSADGYYITGRFDGFRFTPETEVLSAYDTKLPYAAQTYAGISDRTVSVAWFRTSNDTGGFRGMMSIPMELSLFDTKEGPRIRFVPIRELWEYFTKVKEIHPMGEQAEICFDGKPAVVVIEWKTKGRSVIRIGDEEICIQSTEKPATLIIDHGIVEYLSEDGLVYGALEAEETILSKSINIEPQAESITIYEYHMK